MYIEKKFYESQFNGYDWIYCYPSFIETKLRGSFQATSTDGQLYNKFLRILIYSQTLIAAISGDPKNTTQEVHGLKNG